MFYVFEYANSHNFVPGVVGEVLTCEEFEDDDFFGIFSSVSRLLSEKEDFKVVYEEEYEEE